MTQSPPDVAGRRLSTFARWLALLGGAALLAVCAMSAVSILGRWLFGRPVLGDVEITQMGCAAAVSTFLPYAQMKNAHVFVDFFTQAVPAAWRRRLDQGAAASLSVAAAVIAWRSALGGLDMWRAGEESMVLSWPLWPVYAIIAPSFALLALTAAHTARHPPQRSGIPA